MEAKGRERRSSSRGSMVVPWTDQMESRPEGIPTPIHLDGTDLPILSKVAVESIFLIVRG